MDVVLSRRPASVSVTLGRTTVAPACDETAGRRCVDADLTEEDEEERMAELIFVRDCCCVEEGVFCDKGCCCCFFFFEERRGTRGEEEI
jgi:hypothetical protein